MKRIGNRQFGSRREDVSLYEESKPMTNLPSLSRRTFVQASMATCAAAMAPKAFADPLGIAPGIQLYTVGDALQTNQFSILQALAAIGYRNVEAYPGVKSSAQEFRKQLDAAGLRCPSIHMPFTDEDMQPHFADAHTIGASYVVSSVLLPDHFDRSLAKSGIGVMDTLTPDDYLRIAEKANNAGTLAKAAGLQFAYHNHYFEFRYLGKGVMGYDLLLKNTDPSLVKFEIDCGWMIVAGHDPIDYLRSHPGRIPMLHIKDFIAAPSAFTGGAGRPSGNELGRGKIDYRPVFAAAAKAGVRFYFVEQEPPFPAGMTSIEAAKIDYQYLHTL
jgi:sugar phosphate isomerase/epimerase